MGSTISMISRKRRERARKRRSDEIDAQIEKDSMRLKRECRVLLLGSVESDKSTILKQIRIIHGNGLSSAELAEYRAVIYKTILDSARRLVLLMQKAGLEYAGDANGGRAEKILAYSSGPWEVEKGEEGWVPNFYPDMAETIHQLWNDPAILTLMNTHSEDWDLLNLEPHFFKGVLRIGAPGYLPTESDVLRAHHEPVGITETDITMGTLL
ncbi:hypothetical protein D9611_013739 [Ephemerocybe angulata]|uniref:Uncharacterized protein n=1 Tax=Ephemerocybe angulata TaxID=980116 RepID=A0A8H5F271_9AGAR|nr:hypothetical protein D9611_013739 [Tulosesus angulatus]